MITAIVAVGVAMITTTGGVIVAIIQARKVDRVGENIGTPNGHGNLVQMAEQLLAGQADQDQRLAAIEARLGRDDTRLIEIDRRLSQIDGGHTHG